MNNFFPMLEKIKGCFLGLATGDALGVPVEFRSREELRNNPVREMLGFGTWNQPPGTWSDDSSMSFCLAEVLAHEYKLQNVGEAFVRWYKDGYWGAHHKLFDIGGTTRMALARIVSGEDPMLSGAFDEESNGNGSLMRIAPAALYFSHLPLPGFYKRIKEISAITHAHFRSVFSCFIFALNLKGLYEGKDKLEAFASTQKSVWEFARANDFNEGELIHFKRILDGSIISATEKTVGSSGYVIDTLEASFWCFLNADSYQATVLKAVNLGGDTDTTACVAGALAGLYYGHNTIPMDWLSVLARKNDIVKLSENFTQSLKNQILQGNL